MRIRHILLTTDLSDYARLGYPHARYLADRLGARVTLFHVRERPHRGVLPPGELAAYDAALGEAFSQRIVRERDACAEMGLEVDVHSGLGVPSREILTFIAEHGVDLVVLTSHGSRGRRSLLFGSTAKRVVRHVDIPMLLVPADAEAVVVGFRPYSHVLTTTDFSADSELGFDAAIDLCDQLRARLTLAHVVLHPAAIPSLAGEPPAYIPDETLEYIRRHQAQALDDLVDVRPPAQIDTYLAVEPDAPEGIIRAAEAVHADLIVVPSHGKGAIRAVLFGSTSEHVLNLSPVPVLVLPRAWLRLGV